MLELNQDSDLQQRLRSDDKSALEFVYKSYKSEFLNFSKHYKLRNDVAVDIYQDAVIALYQNFTSRQLQLENSTVKTYLFGICKHKIYGLLKTNKKQVDNVVDFIDYDEIEVKTNNLNYYQEQLAVLLKSLSDSCKDLLRLYYYRNLTVNEIVEQTNYKDANTVKSHKSRCLKRLKSMVNN